MDCAVSTPTSYRCKECVKEQQKKFNTAVSRDYVLSAIVAFLIGALGSFVLYFFNFYSMLTAIILGLLLGNLIAKAVRAVTQKRRAADLNKLTAIAAGIGGAVPILRYILGLFRMIFIGNYAGLMGYTLSVGWGILYIALLCTTILTNMRGFAIRRR
jgi:dolichyl-phosphate-mannose--protein O-mannosyl transferase